MPCTFIVAANGSRARFFLRPLDCNTLDEVHDVVLPAAHHDAADAQRQLHSVARYVRQAYTAQAFHDIILIGSAEFLQALRAQLGEPIASLVTGDIEGDCTRFSPQQLLERIGRELRAH